MASRVMALGILSIVFFPAPRSNRKSARSTGSMWFDLDDEDDELGVLEFDHGLELVTIDCRVGVLWLWRGEWGEREWAPTVGDA